MKLMRSEDILTVSISQVVAADWDIRNTPEDEAGIIALANSIKKDGFINPLTCTKHGKMYVVIAGRRRLKAAKILGLKEVPIYLRDDLDKASALRRVALIENCHRKDMLHSERAHGFFEVYKMAGYTKEQTIQGVKSIDNWFDHTQRDKGIRATWENLAENISARDERASPLLYDPKFIEICKDIGFSPKYQYQLMQLIVQLEPEIVKLAEKEGLAINQQIMLTNRALREHPKIQKELIKEIANDLPKKRVKERVQQVAKDLETGYLEQLPNGDYVRNKGKEREIVKGADKVLEPIQVAHLDITKSTNEFLFRLTNRSITKGEFEYSDKIIQNTKNYRLEIIKVLSDRGLSVIENNLTLVADVSLDMLKLIEQEFESRKAKEGMISK